MSTNGWRRLLAITGTPLLAVLAVAAPASAAATRDTAAPAAPAQVRVTAVSFTWVQLAWNPSVDDNDVVGYEASIARPGAEQQQAHTIGTTQGFGGLPAGTTFTATVRAVDAAGNRSAAASVQVTTLERTQAPPSTPANLRAVHVNGVLDSIAWDASEHAAPVSYQLRSGSDVVVSTWETSVTVFELVHHVCLDLGSTHTFTVQAMGAGNYPSGLSAPLTVTLPTTAPRR